MEGKNQKEKYAPVSEWGNAPERFKGLMLNVGEYTVIVDPQTGMGLYLVARIESSLRFHAYMDEYEFCGDFKRITPMELRQRVKEHEKFL